MEKDLKKFEYKLIENKERIESENRIRTSKHQTNPMLEKFLEFRRTKKMMPKDLV